mgnify:CR=1 FL=1
MTLHRPLSALFLALAAALPLFGVHLPLTKTLIAAIQMVSTPVVRWPSVRRMMAAEP